MVAMPTFFDASQTANLWIERTDLVAKEAMQARAQLVFPKSQARIAVFGIDCQIGFVSPGASLAVPGAVADMNRALRFIYRNAEKISELIFSMDTHSLFQIFHPAFWQDAEGQPPAPFTPIASEDIRQGRWRARSHPEDAYRYCQILEKEGKKTLLIWPYHTLLGGISHALVPAVQEAAMFHALLREQPCYYETKGNHAWTEHYSVLEPEVKQIGEQRVGAFNQALYDHLLGFDRIYVWGEASSHCVAETLRSLQRKMQASDPAALDRVYILKDCMSPVPKLAGGPDFPALAEQALVDFQQAGMHVVDASETL